ncbi:MAG: 6,7-dimethyl-8-ribityllumazine synthase [Proteobacteria bacterium]|nr:6,7-dimethyl-8-ribityllumazine synthase [Pseudomonadota bacterium]
MAAPRRDTATPLRFDGARFLIVEGRFYTDINDMLIAGARAAFEAAGGTVEVITMPGALELPIALAIALDAAEAEGRPYAGAVALGCIVRGETYHFEIVSNDSNRALIDLAVTRRLPFGNGILTVENDEQALARARLDGGDKGGDAARAALALLALKHKGGRS